MQTVKLNDDIEMGYLPIDTAASWLNETQVGNARSKAASHATNFLFDFSQPPKPFSRAMIRSFIFSKQ